MEKVLGQVFTTNQILQKAVLDIVGNKSPQVFLEPSVGAGHLLQACLGELDCEKVLAWEIDPTIDFLPPVKNMVTIGDFFDLSNKWGSQVDVIVANPPYMRWRTVPANTQRSASKTKSSYSDNVNLYAMFFDKSIDLLKNGGEAIFIIPKEWWYSTSAKPLRQKIVKNGAITHVVDMGEKQFFENANLPTTIIIRFHKSRPQHEVLYRHIDQVDWQKRHLMYDADNYLFSFNVQGVVQETCRLGDFFDVHVGLVTGAVPVFNVTYHENLFLFQQEGTVAPRITTKGVEYYIDVDSYHIFDDIPKHTREYLKRNRHILVNRKIRVFHENNWWKYGAIRNKDKMLGNRKRFYALERTRSTTPFFMDTENGDKKCHMAGVLGVFLKEQYQNLIQPDAMDRLVNYLNSEEHKNRLRDQGALTGSRYYLYLRILENIEVPAKILL